MIKDIIDSNELLSPNSKQMDALKENFPACFRIDGSFDIERFKEYLSDKLTINNEGYELKFLGKNYARLLASVDTTTVIVPDEKHNDKPENKDSENQLCCSFLSIEMISSFVFTRSSRSSILFSCDLTVSSSTFIFS